MANNVKTLQGALKWLERRIREEVKLDGCTSVDHAAELEFIERMLKKFPLRQCDVGTFEEQRKRFKAFCRDRQYGLCDGCPVVRNGFCTLQWAQMPYEAKEGAEHGEA